MDKNAILRIIKYVRIDINKQCAIIMTANILERWTSILDIQEESL
jgi:hypothetical protein